MWNYRLALEHYGERSSLRLLLFGDLVVERQPDQPQDRHLVTHPAIA